MALMVRGQFLHTPLNPFVDENALVHESDGAVLIDQDHIVASGAYWDVQKICPDAKIVDVRPGMILPGLVDTHVHLSQLNAIGKMGAPLLTWLEKYIFPEEMRLVDSTYAQAIAQGFLKALLRNGTTTALVFGSHLESAQQIFFEAASRSSLRIVSGLALADKLLPDELRTTPERAYTQSIEMIQTWHRVGRIRYAVTPRFALSASPALLEACQSLINDMPDVMFQTHVNENLNEIAAVSTLYPSEPDYLAAYERYGLVGARSVFAHNVHVTDREIETLACKCASIAHCPTSNAFLGSGLFPLRRHVDKGVKVALGTDVGAGTGFSLFQEGLMAYQTQMLHPDGYPLTPTHLLYLATAAGAKALGMEQIIGDLSNGKQADFIVIDPVDGSTLKALLDRAESAEDVLSAIFTLGQEGCVAQVYIAGEQVYERQPKGPTHG